MALERATSALVQNPHDERAVLDFLSELEVVDLDAATQGRPLALRSSPVAQQAGFDVRVVVHPSVAEATASPKTVAFMGPLTYLTFPAYQHEFAAASSAEEARLLLAQISYTRWDRPRRAH